MDINNGNYQNNPNDRNNPNYQNNMYSDSQYNGYQNNMYTPYQAPGGNGGRMPANGLQIASLVCGILAICLSCCVGVPGVILGIVGIICAVNGNKESNNGIGTAGLVCSIIGLILGVLFMIYYVAVYVEAFDGLFDRRIGYDYY